jgi:hypothetical protein
MKISTYNLKIFSPFYLMMREPKVAMHEYVYLDFDKEYLYFTCDKSAMKIKLLIQDKELHKPMFVHGMKFFTMIESADFVEVVGDTFVTNRGVRFILPSLEEEVEYPNMLDYELSDDKGILVFDNTLSRILKQVIQYTATNESLVKENIFFRDGDIVIVSRVRFLKMNVSTSSYGNFVLPFDIAKTIATINMSDIEKFMPSSILSFSVECKQNDDGSSVVKITSDGFSMVFSTSSDMTYPEDIVESEDFRNVYYADTQLTVPLGATSEIINGIKSFNFDADIIYMKFELVEVEDKKQLCISSKESGSYISHTDIVDTDCDNLKFWISYSEIIMVYSILRTMKVENLIIRYKENSPVAYFSAPDKEAEITLVHALIDKMEE